MRCAIVMASHMAKCRRMDAEFYLGSSLKEKAEKLAQAERQVLAAQTRLANLRKAYEVEQERADRLLKDGLVIPLA